jgi:hypothetical protein
MKLDAGEKETWQVFICVRYVPVAWETCQVFSDETKIAILQNEIDMQ